MSNFRLSLFFKSLIFCGTIFLAQILFAGNDLVLPSVGVDRLNPASKVAATPLTIDKSYSLVSQNGWDHSKNQPKRIVLKESNSLISDIYTVRIKLDNPSRASYTHALNPYNKSLVSTFQVDDSPKTISNLLYPYFMGGTTAGGYISPGVTSTDGCGNSLFWTMSAACFIQDDNGTDLLEQGTSFISWNELASVTATGAGFQRGFDYDNHGFGGSVALQKDRYKQIYLNNKTAYDKLGFHAEVLVVPGSDIGYRFGANDMGLDVTSQAGPDGLKDGVIPLGEDAAAEDIYAAIQNPLFIRRNHWQEINSGGLVAEHKGYLLDAYNKSLTKPGIYNWFSHGPGEIGTNNFNYFRDVIDYLKQIGGDDVIGMSLAQYLGYQKTRYAAENGANTHAALNGDYLEITFDMAALQKTVRHKLLSILVSSDADIESITWSPNIKTVSFDPATGLVNILLNEGSQPDPSSLPVRPTIVASSVKISAANPNTVTFEVDRPISQSTAASYEVTGNSVTSVSEVPSSGGLKWNLVCSDNFLSTDVVTLTYKAQTGDAEDIAEGNKMLSYGDLPVNNLSEETLAEDPPLAISIRRDSDNRQIATFNTIAEVKVYMQSLNFNTNLSIVFNNEGSYSLGSRWSLDYTNTNFTLTIKGKDGLASYPVIDCNGLTSDPFRVIMSHVRIKQLKIRSGKYTGDGWGFGDNYTAFLISQQAGTSDCQYTDLILHQGIGGISIGAANGSDQPNISNILIDRVVLTELTGIAIQVGRISSVGGEPETRTDASYTLNNVIIRNITIKDTKNQADIESSGSKFYGQINCRGINHLTIQNVNSDQNQSQPYIVAQSKNILIDKCRATNYSINTGGYKSAFHIEDSEIITIQNSFAKYIYGSLYINNSTAIKLYHNTFDAGDSDAESVVLLNVRKINDIQGNIIVAKGNTSGRACVIVSFYRGAGYVPEISNDFVSEKNNLFVSSSLIFDIYGIGAGNSSQVVRASGSLSYADYKTTYSRGQNSVISEHSALSYTTMNGYDNYLGNLSAGRSVIATQISTINTDITGRARTYPTDIGAYDAGAIISAELFDISTSAGAISPAFNTAIKNYTAYVANVTSSVTVTPTLVDPLATLEVRINQGPYVSLASNVASSPLALNVGDNQAEIKVTSSNGVDVEIYTLLVKRASSSFSFDTISDQLVDENVSYTSSLPSITGTPHGLLKYTLQGPDAFEFSIDHATAIVSMIPRNFEAPADENGDNIYELTIRATDLSNNTSSVSYKITVQNVSEVSSFSIGGITDVILNENAVFTGTPPVLTGIPIGGSSPSNFTIVPIPDTQHYTGQVNGGNNSSFLAQTNWIVNNRQALNIKYLVHLGDVVQKCDNGGNDIEWGRADQAIDVVENPVTTLLPNGIPYGLNVGNHDQSPDGSASGTTTFFNQYFGSSRYSGRDYYGGHYGSNNDNNFQLFDSGGLEFIAINLEYDPLANPAVLTWADDLLKLYPNRRAILSSHYIIKQNGDFGPQGQAIYDKLKFNANLFMMLCGHMNPNGEALRTDDYNGNRIYTLLSDYQDRQNGGNGWLRYMEFLPSENKIKVSTYSPTLNEYETDANSSFLLDYTMTSKANPGSVVYSLEGNDASKFTINTSSGIVSMVSRNFEEPADHNSDNIYEVTVKATDFDGNTNTKSFKVTVANVTENAIFLINGIEDTEILENSVFVSAIPAISGNYIGKITYSLSGTDASKFSINSLTGVVSMVSRDFRNPADTNGDNLYEAILLVTDSDGNSASRNFNVQITAVNSSKPLTVDDVACTSQNSPVTLEIIGYDSKTGTQLDYSSIDINPAPGVQKSFEKSGEGSYSINNSGVLKFIPDQSFKGTAAIYYTIMDVEGKISDPTNIKITVNASPKININISEGSQNSCPGSVITFKAVVSDAGSSPSYQWKIDGQNAGSNSPVFSSSQIKDGQLVSCILIPDLECGVNVSSNAIKVSLMPEPKISASGALTFPTGSNVNLSTSKLTGYTYEWLKNGNVIPGSTNNTYTAYESGSYQVRILYAACVILSSPTIVNVFFGLPPATFKISYTNETCRSANNGSITIISEKTLNYIAIISGNGKSETYMFQSLLNVNNLIAGKYEICIQILDQPDYKTCYTVNITEPKELSLYSIVNTSNSTLSLNLNGSDSYLVDLNGISYTIDQDQVTLPLAKGNNKLKVGTAKDCQGIIERNITLAVLYPNPFENNLTINTGLTKSVNSSVKIADMQGRSVYSGQHIIENGSIFLDISYLNTGFYLLKLSIDNAETVYKIQKR